jgi:serine/threonine-protein kinase
MSPEQLRSARYVDHRTDIWALGVILYELLTGRLPFYAHTVTELVLVVVTEREPTVRSPRPDVPEGVSQAIARCLAKRPEERFQSVAELAHALEPFAMGPTASAADRIRGVALQSNRALPSSGASGSGAVPPGASSSSPVNFHGGTSVAWGETQMDPPGGRGTRRTRSSLVAVLVSLGLILATGAGGGAIWYVKRASATTAQNPPLEPIPLPSGRKDLPPLPTAGVAGDAGRVATHDTSPIPEALPETRHPPIAPNGPTAATGPARPQGRPNAGPPPVPPPQQPTDLSNIGRR